MKYSHIVLGGTFDLLHLGHQQFLSAAYKLGSFVTIGLTTDKFNQGRDKPSFQNQDLRYQNLADFLTKKGYLKRSKIILINDIFGTTLKDPTLEAIVVTAKTKKVVNLINRKRKQSGLKELKIIIVPFIKDNKGQIISSSRIRDGEINSLGQNYKKLLLKVADKKLSESIRAKLKNPLGQLLSNPPYPSNPPNPFITVGDITTANFLKAGLSPNIAIIDGRVNRNVIPRSEATWESLLIKIASGPTGPRNDSMVKVKNHPGQISKSLILTVDKVLKKFIIHNSKFIILIEGEEDLATIPAILLSPLGTRVYYGQPNQGLVEVKVDLEIKDKLIHILF